MKRPFVFFAALFALCAAALGGCNDGEITSAEAAWKVDGKMKILFIGNSFADDTKEYGWQIAKSLGVEEDVLIGCYFKGSCTIDMHLRIMHRDSRSYTYWRNSDGVWTSTEQARFSTAFEEESLEGEDGWDYIVLSTGSGNGGSFCDPASYANLEEYLSGVREYAPKAKFLWNMTWAGHEGYSHRDMTQGQLSMYQRHAATVQSEVLTKPDIAGLVATGTAIQNARTSRLGDTLDRDGWHLSVTGRYIAGLTLIGTVFGIPLTDDVFCPEGISEEVKQIALESARNAIAQPLAVTPSQYTE